MSFGHGSDLDYGGEDVRRCEKSKHYRKGAKDAEFRKENQIIAFVRIFFFANFAPSRLCGEVL
jgi:hypothetical protein